MCLVSFAKRWQICKAFFQNCIKQGNGLILFFIYTEITTISVLPSIRIAVFRSFLHIINDKNINSMFSLANMAIILFCIFCTSYSIEWV